MAGSHLLDGLNEAQLHAVTADVGPVVVLAGAGSGKTRVLTRRIAWRVLEGVTDPNRVLALTFTRKSAAELRARQLQLGLRDTVTAGTFHAIALTQLRQRWHERRKIEPTLISSKVRLLTQLLPSQPKQADGSPVSVLEIMSEIDWARASLVTPEAYAAEAKKAGRKPPIKAADISELMVLYQQDKRRKRLVDFDDLLTLAIRDLEADADYSAAVRWRHRHFYVDEFQDVNPLQNQLLQQWIGDRDDYFLVGDPNQAIYGWNGADPELLKSMAKQESATVIELRDNYRSTAQILSAAVSTLPPQVPLAKRNQAAATESQDEHEALALQGVLRLPNERPDSQSNRPANIDLRQTNSPDSVSETEVVSNTNVVSDTDELDRKPGEVFAIAHQPDGPPPTITAYATDRSEADGIAQLMVAERSTFDRWDNQAVLVRTNAQLVVIEQALSNVGIPTRVRTGPGLLGTTEVKAELKSMGRAGLDLRQHLERLDESLAVLGQTPGQAQSGIALERHNNLSALSRLVHEYLLTDPLPNGQGLMAWIETMEAGAIGPDEDAVDLTTFHGSKGLEWPTVHIAGLEDGFVPIAYASTAAQQAEEQRLLYVALTRAERHLHLSWSMERTFGTSAVKRSPSPYLTTIQDSVGKMHPTPPTGDVWRSYIRESRQALAVVDDPADTTALAMTALLKWRKTKARASQVPERAIVPERTLQRIAEHQPVSRTQLAKVSDLRPVKLERFGDEILETLASTFE